MKTLFKRIKENKGFSLVEVMVAMIVIAVISIPLIHSFVMSANVNRKSKRLQNATDIGQNVSEYFASVSLLDLDDKYSTNSAIRGAYYEDPDTGIVVFQNVGSGTKIDDSGTPYYEGADGEKFYVTVVLNPEDYSNDDPDLSIEDINDYLTPELGDLFSVETVTAYSQFTKYDARIKNALRTAYPGVTALETIDYDDIKKTVNVYIDQSKNASDDSKINYTYSLTVTYTYCTKQPDGTYIEVTNSSGDTYSLSYHFVVADDIVGTSQKMPDLYLLYTPFDTNDTDYSNQYARDEIIFNYRVGGVEETWEKNVNIYLVQQDGGNGCKGLDINKIKIKAYSEAVTMASTRYPTINKLDMYSNVDGWDKNVTAGTNPMLKLYSLDVYVRYNKKDTNVIDAYVNNTFTDDYYTVVSTIKEE